MKIKFWGTRGSLPQATTNTDFIGILDELIQTASALGIRTTRTFKAAIESGELGQPVVFGGNTTCTEVIHDDEFCFVDMGSGLREAGTFYMQKGVKEFHIFLTHMHWDHIMGLPFF
ncbi:MAG: MBL fold metallo-hydrolase, partial [Proteobacteria bacterium]|nr:MBL fold metallo-hydrolase [Pseudomonadota bacterium]